MDIYIKPIKKASIAERKLVFVKDICEVVAEKEILNKIKNIQILEIKATKKTSLFISVTDIVSAIKKKYPEYTINNLGEMDTLIDYSPVKSKDNKYIKWGKIIFVSLVLFAGSATAIMSFHSDAQMATVFDNYYKIFFGKKIGSPWLIEVPYSVGLAVGIIVFFNHFLGKKITDDPTPIEVEMSIYETDVTDTMIDILNTKKIRAEEDENVSP